MRPVAALFVDVERGPYAALGCDVWGEDRDARLYPGTHAVVAHPPCARWGRLWWTDGSEAPGSDDGCFSAAKAAVDQWGGVLEHPSGSLAFQEHRIKPPSGYHWRPIGGRAWVCMVDQGAYGHRARKPTWLYYVGAADPRPILPALKLQGIPECWVVSGPGGYSAEERAAKGIVLLPKSERHITPGPFAERLVALARGRRGR